MSEAEVIEILGDPIYTARKGSYDLLTFNRGKMYFGCKIDIDSRRVISVDKAF